MLHRAAKLIDAYSKDGCPADYGADWTREQIEAAIGRGPHPLAKNPDAQEVLFTETDDKVEIGYAKVVRYCDIKHKLLKKSKILPVAMIPHKSRLFRTILDLFFRLRHFGKLTESINLATVKQALAESMIQLGQCVQRLIALLADNFDPDQPFLFSKLDIKDGFWRMAINDNKAWSFCYDLPSNDPNIDIDDIKIVVPNCLQMGWCESPPFFCAETARDVIESLLQEVTLPVHPFEDKMLDKARETVWQRLSAAVLYVNLVEVFVDDFIGATNNSTMKHLEHFSWAMLFGVHSIFPLSAVSGHHGQDPVLQKKLAQGKGLWETTKEILGWLVNGAKFTVQTHTEQGRQNMQTHQMSMQSKDSAKAQVPGTRQKNPTCIIWRPWRQRIIFASAQSTENKKGLHCDDIGPEADAEGLENTHPTHDFKSDISEAPRQRIPKHHQIHGHMQTLSRRRHHSRHGSIPTLGLAVRVATRHTTGNRLGQE